MSTDNHSGIKPLEYNVLVKPQEAERKTKGGIILSDETVEKNEFAQMEGILIAKSPVAFDFAEGTAHIPEIGDRVIFSRYQGTEITGKDGQKYWLMKDKAISGVVEA